MNLRKEIYRLVYNHEELYGKCEECEYRASMILQLIERRIEEIYQSDEILCYSDNSEVSFGIDVFQKKVKAILK